MAIFPRKEDLTTPGVFQYIRQSKTSKKRIHLRIDEDGHGTLLINANRIFHFNPSATLMAHAILENIPEKTIIEKIIKRYDVNRNQAHHDFLDFSQQLSMIISPDEEICPICDLNVDVSMPFSKNPTAPYRMDLALTYICNNDCAHCYNIRPRTEKELTTEQWKQLLDKIWGLGIPHVVFTGGEPTVRNDLVELITYAEKTGFITGLNTNGRLLMEKEFVDKLCHAGLDHVQITLESQNNKIHDEIVNRSGAWEETIQGIQNALNSSLFVMTNTTLLINNSHQLESLLLFLGEIGVPTVGLNGLIHSGRGKNFLGGIPEANLPHLLDIAKNITTQQEQRLIWYTPTQYCHFDPVMMELGVKGCTAALYNMCVEPNGNVIPCQSYYHSLGNLLHDSWDSIWNHELAIHIRERKYISDKCKSCAVLQECGGGCPLYQKENGSIYPEKMLEIHY